jgi:hypothetical protein
MKPEGSSDCRKNTGTPASKKDTCKTKLGEPNNRRGQLKKTLKHDSRTEKPVQERKKHQPPRQQERHLQHEVWRTKHPAKPAEEDHQSRLKNRETCSREKEAPASKKEEWQKTCSSRTEDGSVRTDKYWPANEARRFKRLPQEHWHSGQQERHLQLEVWTTKQPAKPVEKDPRT